MRKRCNYKVGFICLILMFSICVSCSSSKKDRVLIKTQYGNIRFKLYDDTPIHKENFIKQIESGNIDHTIFHRVIKDFMIQGGMPGTGDNNVDGIDKDLKLPAEIIYPKHYHKKGALAAARMADNVNPEKRSSAYQFYIVQGEVYNDDELNSVEYQMTMKKIDTTYSRVMNQLQQIQSNSEHSSSDFLNERESLLSELRAEIARNKVTIPDSIREVYETIGGCPKLDGDYTVFGEIDTVMTISDKINSLFGKNFGYETIDAISECKTNEMDKPYDDIIMNIQVVN